MKKELSDLIDEKIAKSTAYYAGKAIPSMEDLNSLSSKEKNIKEMFKNKKTADSFLQCFSTLP